MAPVPEAVYATLLMSDAYLPGAMVLGHSLKDKGARAKLVVLATMGNVSAETITELQTIYDEIIPINRITNRTPANLYVMDRPDLISTFSKIELWRQTQYRQIVYIDADVVAIRAPNELLTLDADFAAAPDIGWPDCFNSGVMVLRPNMGDYYSLQALAQRGISFDGADQGLLNMHFRDWERLSFTYNCTPNSSYQYIPAYRHFQSSISMIHFIGRDKPWTLGRENKHTSGVYGELLGRWWATYDKHYRTPEKSATGAAATRAVPQHVAGEQYLYQPTYPSMQAPVISVMEAEPEVTTTEAPMGDQPEPIEEVTKEDFAPTPTVPQRTFSAPQAEWDPSRAPPPIHSKPEALNFPSQTYEMSVEKTLFTPPNYPEPPKDMYYRIPEKPIIPPKPKPIFPWEGRIPKATRVFPAQRAPSPPAIPASLTKSAEPVEEEPAPDENASDENRATPQIVADWKQYDRQNAWDDVPAIERYVQAFVQARRGPIQVLHQTPSAKESVTSPPTTEAPRRPSMKITDFPTEIERPSLPVTPAPIRKPSFWGEERDELGELPAADGVPKQEEWNPTAKLEELQRRQSEVLEKGPQLEPKTLPDREMPGSKDAAGVAAAAERVQATATAPKPTFSEPMFSGAHLTALPSTSTEVSPEVSATA